MSKKMLPVRKHPRLQRFDYSSNARYFVTICTYQKRSVLSKVKVGRGLAPAETLLTEAGKIIEDELLLLPLRFHDLTIDNYVIMPNHIHAILTINAPLAAGASPRPTLMDIIGIFKSLCTRRCKAAGVIDKLWQTSFYDHIIRNEHDYKAIWQYIDNNPAKWTEDPYFE